MKKTAYNNHSGRQVGKGKKKKKKKKKKWSLETSDPSDGMRMSQGAYVAVVVLILVLVPGTCPVSQKIHCNTLPKTLVMHAVPPSVFLVGTSLGLDFIQITVERARTKNL